MTTVKDLLTGTVHRGFRGGRTSCGTDTKNQPWHWYDSKEGCSCKDCEEH